MIELNEMSWLGKPRITDTTQITSFTISPTDTSIDIIFASDNDGDLWIGG